jgi:Carboxypeptidase regulatory-like domain
MLAPPKLLRALCLGCCALTAAAATAAQQSAAISGIVRDAAGAAVPSAQLTAQDLETGVEREAATDAAGVYQFLALPVGRYQLTVRKTSFRQVVRGGIDLAVGEQATIDITLVVGEVQQQVTISAQAPLVSTAITDISGLVGEEQIQDLPLNGRSYDQLATINAGVVNFTWEKTGGIGVSNSTTGNMFAVDGNRPQQNLFLLNGVEYTGAAENNMQPGGASGQLLGVDAVREFTILRDSYGVEYGKHPGGQVSIVTQSGTNQWHGSLFAFLRNSALDARNFFDQGSGPPPFERNQFGAASGGPLEKQKTFLFASYEGFRQRLEQTSAELVPDAQSRADAAPMVQQLGLLNLWPVASPGAPDFKVSGPNGIAEASLDPLQAIREDFGTVRLDRTFSPADSASIIYTVDDSGSVTATSLDAFSTDMLRLREQVLSLEETHVFSMRLINSARFGFSRAGYFYTGEPTAATPAATVAGFLSGQPVGAVVVGGSQASNPQAQLGLAGSNNGSNLHLARNLFTASDQLSWAPQRQQWNFGLWLQPFQSNEELALSQFGQMTFTGLPTLLSGMASFLYDPSPTPLAWRSLFGALYADDELLVSAKLSVSLGFRDEFSTGWHEAYGRAANYTFSNGVISTQPNIGDSLFTKNRAEFLPQPRLGLAWSPFGGNTVFRAGFGIYNDLQDALGYRADQNAPFNPTYTIAAGPIANLALPIHVDAPAPANALLVPGGVQPDLYMPTVESWSVKVERQVTPNTALSVGYAGNHGYHELVGADANAPEPVVCPAAPCPATFPTTTYVNPTTGLVTTVWGALAGQPVPAGTFYIAPGTPRPNPALGNTWTWFSEGDSSYNALQVDVKHRFSKGLFLRGVYTFSKTLDDGDSLNATAAANAPGLVANPYDMRADWGLATFDARHAAVVTASYDLPFGRGRRWGGRGEGWAEGFVAGWSVHSIVTAQSGFPFTPQLSYNPSNDGDTRDPVRPFLNPAFSGSIVTHNPNLWFNPNAFLAPPNNSGFFGNVGRDTLIGPGLATWDFSLLKDTRLREGLDLQFRAEIFNLLNRANFNTPNLIADVLLPAPNATVPVISPAAGVITSTSTSARQIQLALKLWW